MFRKHINWERTAPIASVGVSALSFTAGLLAHNIVYVIALRVIAVICILLWAAWVTAFLIRHESAAGADPQLEGYEVRATYFDGTGRNFIQDVEFWSGNSEVKAAGLEGSRIGDATSITNDGVPRIRIQRHHYGCDWIMSVIKYRNPATALNDRYIPPDPDSGAEGGPARYIYVRFAARVENDAHRICMRWRASTGYYLRKSDESDAFAARTVRIGDNTWASFHGILGPVRADQPCYVSLDIRPGPKGEKQGLFIRDLLVLDVREKRR